MILKIGDSLEMLRDVPDNTYDAIVTDSPYGLSSPEEQLQFQLPIMQAWIEWAAGSRSEINSIIKPKAGLCGKAWDAWVPDPSFWDICRKKLKPGGYLITFAATRTFDLMSLSLRLAGFLNRGMLAWHYAMGQPRGMAIDKAIDQHLGYDPIQGNMSNRGAGPNHIMLMNSIGSGASKYASGLSRSFRMTHPASPEAQRFAGWNTSLKPATEPICLMQKPISEPSIAQNVLKWGTGGLNIDACRVGDSGAAQHSSNQSRTQMAHGRYNAVKENVVYDMGRFPSNVIFTHHPECNENGCVSGACPIHELTQQHASAMNSHTEADAPSYYPQTYWTELDGFRYCQKPSIEEKDAGLANTMPPRVLDLLNGWIAERYNPHISVKPVELMRWLLHLVVPPGGMVLDPFAGSGTTGVAATLNQQEITLMELDPEMREVIVGRCAYAEKCVQEGAATFLNWGTRGSPRKPQDTQTKMF